MTSSRSVWLLLLWVELQIKDNLYDKDNYSERKIGNNRQVQYLHSLALIDYVTKKLESNSNSIMEKLKEEK